MEDTFLFLQKLLKHTNGISLFRVDYANAPLPSLIQAHTAHISALFYSDDHPAWQQFERLFLRPENLYQWQLPGGITFLLHASGYCLGPMLTQPYSHDDTLRMLGAYNLKPQAKRDILHFCSTLPVVESHTLHRIGLLTVGHLTGQEDNLQIAYIQPPVPELSRNISPVEENIVQMRQVESRYESSAALTKAVSQGNLSLALHMISHYDPGSQTTVRNTNPLRNAQNYCIVLNTQLRHALKETGIHPYQMDKLSNQIGLEIEQLKSTKQLPQFFRQVLTRYCRLVQEHTYPNLKPLTHLTVTYVKEHLGDNLTVKDTAKALTVNANYLSNLFHRDMGMTFIDFVNRERTRQAAALLKHTNLQIQQVASTVGYNNTSYFAKQFMRFYGVSPSHYRQENL